MSVKAFPSLQQKFTHTHYSSSSFIVTWALIQRTACPRAHFSGCSSRTNGRSETWQMTVSCLNLLLCALNSISALPLVVRAISKVRFLFEHTSYLLWAIRFGQWPRFDALVVHTNRGKQNATRQGRPRFLFTVLLVTLLHLFNFEFSVPRHFLPQGLERLWHYPWCSAQKPILCTFSKKKKNFFCVSCKKCAFSYFFQLFEQTLHQSGK